MRIVETIHMTQAVEDWSRVRSRSRAERRRRQGHRQNIVVRQLPRTDALVVGDVAYMHPVTAAQLRRMIPSFHPVTA